MQKSRKFEEKSKKTKPAKLEAIARILFENCHATKISTSDLSRKILKAVEE